MANISNSSIIVEDGFYKGFVEGGFYKGFKKNVQYFVLIILK